VKTIALEIKAYDSTEDQEITIYLSNNGYISASADTPSSTFFAGLMVSGYEFEQSMIGELGIGGGATLSAAAIQIALGEDILVVSNGTGNLTRFQPQLLARMDFRARPSGLVIKTSEDKDAAYSTFTTVWTGTISTWSATRDVLTLEPASRDEELQKPLDVKRYKGLGGAIRCNYNGATGDYVEVTDAAELDQQTTFTIEVIAKRTGDSGNATQYLLLKTDLWAIEMDTSGNLTAWHVTSDNTKHILTSTHVLSGTEWEHVSVMWKSTESTSVMFVDGADVSATYSTGSLTQSLTGNLRWGMGASGTEAEVDVAQLRIWSDVRTDDEVFDNLWLLMDGTEVGLVGSWAVNEGTGSTTADDTSAANTGTLTGGAAWIHSLEGEDWNLKGKPKPVSEGQVLNREAVLVDVLRLIYDLSEGGFDKIHNVYANRDGIDVDTTVGTAGDTTDLFTNSPVAAKFIFDSTTGRIKLGSNYGDNTVITADVQVGATSSIKPGNVFQNFIVNWAPGFDGSDFGDFSSFNSAIRTNGSAGIGLLHQDTSAAEHMTSFINGYGGIWWFSRLGKFGVDQLEPPDDRSTDHTLVAGEVAISECELLYQIPPSKQIRIGYDRFWRVHTASEVSAAAAAADLKEMQRATSEYIYHDSEVHGTVEADYPGAVRRVIESYAVFENHSGTSENRNQTFRSSINVLRFLLRDERRVLRIPLARPPSSDDEFDLNDIVVLDLSDMSNPMFGITSAQKWLLLGILQSDRAVTLTLWG
jgi:hypothetical protein